MWRNLILATGLLACLIPAGTLAQPADKNAAPGAILEHPFSLLTAAPRPMKIAFFDCPSGISGDMTLGALTDCGVSLAAMQAGIDSLGYPGVKLVAFAAELGQGARGVRRVLMEFAAIVRAVALPPSRHESCANRRHDAA